MGAPQVGQGCSKRPWTAMSFRNAVTFSGKAWAASALRRVDPELERVACGGEEALPLLWSELRGLQDGREASGVEDLVGVGVADAGEDARVGEGALEGAVFDGEGGAEGCEVGGEDVDASCVEFVGGGPVGEEVEGGAAFGAGFGEDERAVGKVECGEVVSAAEFCAKGTPVEAAGDHEVKDEPEAVVEFEGDAFADAMETADGVAFDVFDAGLDCAEEEGAGDPEVCEGLADDAGFEGGEVGGDVGEFWHGCGLDDDNGLRRPSVVAVRGSKNRQRRNAGILHCVQDDDFLLGLLTRGLAKNVAGSMGRWRGRRQSLRSRSRGASGCGSGRVLRRRWSRRCIGRSFHRAVRV